MIKVRNDLDAQRLQNNLESINEWTRIDNMALNSDKFEHMGYGKFNSSNVVHLSSVGATEGNMFLILGSS